MSKNSFALIKYDLFFSHSSEIKEALVEVTKENEYRKIPNNPIIWFKEVSLFFKIRKLRLEIPRNNTGSVMFKNFPVFLM